MCFVDVVLVRGPGAVFPGLAGGLVWGESDAGWLGGLVVQREALGTLDLLKEHPDLHLEVTKVISAAFASLLGGGGGGAGGGGGSAGGGGA